MSVEPFRSVLSGLGLDPTPREIAEILWLATRLPAAPTPAAEDVREAESPQVPAERTGDTLPVLPGEQAPPPDAPPTVPVYAPAATRSSGSSPLSASPVRLAADPLLPRQLELLRALRPLKRRVPSRQAGEFDEEATLESMAQRSVPHRKGALLPVLRPAAERWLDAVLVVDGHPTGLLLWTPLVREVHRLLIQLGAFRDVRLRYLHSRADGSAGLSAHPAPSPDRIRSASEIHDPSGRRLVLVLTDGVAPGWQDPSVREAMRQWAAAGPLVVLQALPERLWRRTALPAVPARLRRAPLSAANTDLVYSGRRRGKRELPEGSIPVPVLELSPEWLRPWAELLGGVGTPVADAAVTLLAADPGPPRAVADDRSPTRRLQDFHATATPEAFRLLACLSAVPLTVAIMRVVQAAMLPGTPPTVLAEVMFSGLITPVMADGSTAPADVPHDFLPGVRAVLLESLRAHEVDQILREVSGFVERGGGVGGRVSGLLPDSGGGEGLAADGIPWARLREEALVRAGLAVPVERGPSSAADNVHGAPDPYRLTGLITIADFSDVHLGVDADGNRAVVKTRPNGTDLEPEVVQELLRVEAEALRRMAGQYAPPLLAVDGEVSPTWLAMGYVTSISSRAAHNLVDVPWSSNGPADDFHSLSQLARRLAEALDRAHTAGVVHGNLSPHAVLVVPDTVVLISWVYAQFDGRPHAYPQYRERATGYFPPEGYSQDEALDPSFDMYGLGAILLREATRGGVFAPHQRDLSGLLDELGGLRTLIARCLDVDPGRRPTARQFLDELGGLAAPRETAERRGLSDRLDSMPGLEGVKRFLEHLRTDTEVAEELRALVFTGNPGTGKTTAARMVGETCRDLGLLSRGHLVEARMSDVVGEYAGQTAALTNRLVDSALDGVLFIDDAYELADQLGGVGGEAIHTLLERMEDDRGRLVVIIAGSPKKRREFLEANSGLVSRFPVQDFIDFPDLDPDTLMTILEGRIEDYRLRLAEEAVDRLRQIVAEMHRTRNEDFANAHDMRALADAVVSRWASRVGGDVGALVTVDDIPEYYRAYLPRPTPAPSVLLAEVDDYTGLGRFRAVLEDLEGRLREDRALNEGPPPHLLFTGLPGTGKSPLARFVGRLLNNRGILRRGHCVEVTPANLVAPHAGQTAPLVRQAVQAALDGVLYIDEAHSLGEPMGGDGGFGAEAIDTLMREMENQRDRLCVIVAGDPQQMDAFVAANPGLSSRFGTHVRFPPYDTADLVEILRRTAAKRNYTLAPGVPARAAAWLDAARLVDPSGSGDARVVRRLLDQMEMHMVRRHHRVLPAAPAPVEFRPEDVPGPPATLPPGWTTSG
ncbi:SAV_2336 N-terminal domain-related protein [Streptomyces fulvoviolaceus]|uniref:SAV_2336 N-terminal domain-related protein n=1 Tax=Streptomyces fulvoviolaceus TaxID=285535 RepID=UPI0021BEF2CD|nr:SAV_2336 N-terminal domain-related protein [Streptomyces fulvoviolaceus]MCT9083017.1 SAV_2336 family protein [Streptomyces fulvoviolaceus]